MPPPLSTIVVRPLLLVYSWSKALNVLQNASICTISKEKIQKIFEPPPNHMPGYGPEETGH